MISIRLTQWVAVCRQVFAARVALWTTFAAFAAIVATGLTAHADESRSDSQSSPAFPSASYASPGATPEPPMGALAEVALEQRLGEALPLDLPFFNEDGRETPLKAYFDDRPVILALVYYECPMLCTQVLNGLTRSVRAQALSPGRDFEVVAISISPSEKPDLAQRKKTSYLGSGDGDAMGWHFLTGPESSIKALAAAVGYSYRYDERSGQYAHPSGIVVVTPQGVLSRYFYGIDYPTRDLRLALVESSDGKIGSPVDQFLLLCFHYDPSVGRYGLAIQSILRGLGIATLGALGAFIGWSLRRERRSVSRRGDGARGLVGTEMAGSPAFAVDAGDADVKAEAGGDV